MRGAILEKRYDAHPPSWLVVLAGQQKRSQKLGNFFADKSSDFGSTSSRGCLISIMHHIVYSSHVLAYNSDTDLTSSLTRQQLAAAFSHGRSISK